MIEQHLRELQRSCNVLRLRDVSPLEAAEQSEPPVLGFQCSASLRLLETPGLETGNPGFSSIATPLPTPRKTPIRIPNHPPLLVWEYIGVHSTVERCAGASFGGWDGGFWGRVRAAIYENPGFPNPGFRNPWASAMGFSKSVLTLYGFIFEFI